MIVDYGHSVTIPQLATNCGAPKRECFQFKIYDLVTHRDQHMPSIVLTRRKIGGGGEIYGIRTLNLEVDGACDLLIIGDCLRPLRG